MSNNERECARKQDGRALGNNLTLEELFRIEENAHRSHTSEADIILRLSAALREAMQIKESAIALISVYRTDGKAQTTKEDFVRRLRH